MMALIDELPSDMLWEIATWLDPQSYLQMQATCKRFNKVLGVIYRRIEYRRIHTRTETSLDGCWVSTIFWIHELRTCIVANNRGGIGDMFWYFKNEQHRDDDKPAIERANGDKEWWRDGKCHRDGDKPAIEFANGDREWRQMGKIHRDGGKPAIVRQWR